MEKYLFLTQPLIGAITGCVTVWILVWLLFHPRQPKKIAGLTLHGILPRNKPQLAAQLGKMAADMVDFEELATILADKEHMTKLTPVIEKHLDHFLEVKVKEKMPFISMFIGSSTIKKVKDSIMEELDTMLPNLIHQYAGSLKENVDIEQLVTEKLSDFEIKKIESALHSALNKKMYLLIALPGAIVGLLAGLVQAIFSLLF